jgi:hypothetical protein
MVFTVRATIEVLGYPEDHVKQVTEKVLEKLSKEEGIQLLKKQVADAEKVKEKFFSSFTEVEIKVNEFSKLLTFCHDYLPSSLEIVDTEKITMPIREFNFGLNEMLQRLHHYNLVVNNLTAQLEQIKQMTGTEDDDLEQ